MCVNKSDLIKDKKPSNNIIIIIEIILLYILVLLCIIGIGNYLKFINERFLLVHICFSLSLILFWSNNLKFEIWCRILNKLYVDINLIKFSKKKINKLWKKIK